MFFSQDHREQVKKDHPDASFGMFYCFVVVARAVLINVCTGELGKILGNKWKEMDDDEKKVCLELSVSKDYS